MPRSKSPSTRRRSISGGGQRGEQKGEEKSLDSGKKFPVCAVDLTAVPLWPRKTVVDILLSPWFAWTPILTCLFAGGVIIGCHYAARAFGHVPEWLRYPAISFTYYQEPNHGLASFGFFLVFLAFCGMMIPFVSVAFVTVERELLRQLYLTAFLAFVAFWFLFLQAFLPLQANFLGIIEDRGRERREDVMVGDVPKLALQSVLHQLCAVSFFLSAMAHGVTLLWLLHQSKSVPIAKSIFPINWWAKVVALCLVIIPASISFFNHPGTSAEGARRTTIELAGITQWGAVASVIAFFATYSADFYAIRSFALENRHVLIQHHLLPPTKNTTTSKPPPKQVLHLSNTQHPEKNTYRQLLERVLTMDGQVFV